MIVDLASYRARKSRDDRARELALWNTVSGTYLSLCDDGLIDFDKKVLRKLWDDYCRDMPEQLRAREMMGPPIARLRIEAIPHHDLSWGFPSGP